MDVTSKDGGGRAAHEDVLILSVPMDEQCSAPHVDVHGAVEQAAADTGNSGGTSAGAASQGFASTALMHSQADGVAIDYLHKAGIDPAWKARVTFDQRAVLCYRSLVDVGYDLHGMRVAHRDGSDVDRVVADLQGLVRVGAVLAERAVEGNVVGQKARCAHVDADIAVVFEAQGDDAGAGFDADFPFVGQFLFMYETHKTARPVAALLNFTAVGIEDAVAEIDTGLAGGLDDEDLVAADAEISVGQPPGQGRRQGNGLAQGVDDDKIVAQAVHFGEAHERWRGEVKDERLGVDASPDGKGAARRLGGLSWPYL